MNFPPILRKLAAVFKKAPPLSGVNSSRGWVTLFRSDRGWQADEKVTQEDAISYSPVYACVTQIASDIGKICLRLMALDAQSGIWSEAISPAFSPVLRKPNHYQTRQQFIETWVISKLLHGNAYIYKERDGRGVVVALYVLDPNRVTPLVAPNSDVYYQLMRDDLSTLQHDYPAVPASEIIHDRMECLFHPLVGISPLFAALLSANQGLRIQQNSERFFRNQSRPGGMLTAPSTINDETAARLKEEFESKYSGDNLGRLFVGGDGLEYKPMADSAVNAQLVEQLKMSAEQVCSAFHVPAFMVGFGQAPTQEDGEGMIQQYFSQCLQKMFNAIEDLLDDALGLSYLGYRTEFELDDLMRMNPLKLAEVIERYQKAGVMAPNEGRKKIGLKPVKGGDSPMVQQQNYSLEALAKRDAKEDPFAAGKPSNAPTPAPTTSPSKSVDQTDKALHLLLRKSPEELINA